jgi:transposase-like protein
MEAAEPIIRRRRSASSGRRRRSGSSWKRRVGLGCLYLPRRKRMGSTPNQVFYWRKLYEAGQLESTVLQSTGDLGARAVRLLSVSVDEGAERQAPGATAASTADLSAGSDALPRSIELTLARGQVRIAGTVDAGTLRTVLRCLLAWPFWKPALPRDGFSVSRDRYGALWYRGPRSIPSAEDQ